MKLYNKSAYPDDILEPIIKEAGKAIGCRTTNVIVKVTNSKPYYMTCRGVAQQAYCVYKWTLDDRAYKKNGDIKDQPISTDGGWIRLVVPYPIAPKEWLKSWDLIGLSENIYNTACHEWQHIKQYQTHKYLFYDRKERAKNHDNRAWEKDAIKASSKATKSLKPSTQDLILKLALYIEEVNK